MPVVPNNNFGKFEFDYLNEYMHENDNQYTSPKMSDLKSTTTQSTLASAWLVSQRKPFDTIKTRIGDRRFLTPGADLLGT